MRESDPKAALVPVQATALTLSGAKSLAARGRADLRTKGEAEEWLKRGVEFRKQGGYEEALACFDRGIQLDPNHPELQHMLGVMYGNGLGAQQDDTEAAVWYRKGAEQGLPSAQNSLAFAHECGKGVPKDDNQAVFWYSKAAEQGDVDSQFMLAVMYREVRGVPYDPEQAVFWFRKAAEQDDVMAQMEMGWMYEDRKIVPQDYAQAAYWYLKVAVRDGWGAWRLGHFNEQGLGVHRVLEQASHWYRKAAEDGEDRAKAALFALASEVRYQQLSPEEKNAVLDDLEAVTEQGLVSPSVKPSFLGIDPGGFVGPQHEFGGNPLPEFCSISRDILDCFATVLLSTPELEFPASPLVMRCRLGEDPRKLMLYLTAMVALGEQTLPVELKEESEVWIGSNLRSLAEVRGLALGNIFWDSDGRHSLFFFDYPGKMVGDKVPGLGAPGGDGKPRWPECKLLLVSVTATLRKEARRAIHFVQSTTEGSIQ